MENVNEIINNRVDQLVNNPDSDINQRVHNIIDQLRRNKNGSY